MSNTTKKIKTKQELLSLLSRCDLIEATISEISKSAAASSKKTESDKFSHSALAYIKDDRQVLLIAIKLR